MVSPLDVESKLNMMEYERIRNERLLKEREEEILKRQPGITTLMSNNPVTWDPRTWGSGITDMAERSIGNLASGNLGDIFSWFGSVPASESMAGKVAQWGDPDIGSGLIYEDGVPVGIKEEYSKPGSQFDMFMGSENPLVDFHGPDVPGNIMEGPDGSLTFLKSRATHDPLHGTYYDPVKGQTVDDNTGEVLHTDWDAYNANVNHIRDWDIAYGTGEALGIIEGIVGGPAAVKGIVQLGGAITRGALKKAKELKAPIIAGLVSSGVATSEAEANQLINKALKQLNIKNLDEYLGQTKYKMTHREAAETFKNEYKTYLKETGKKDTPNTQNSFQKFWEQRSSAINNWVKNKGLDQEEATELWSKVMAKAGGTNKKQVVALVDEWLEGGFKDELGNDIELEWWLNPTQPDGTPYKNLDKYRKRIRLGAEQWKENRRATRTDDSVWSGATDKKTWQKSQTNRILKWMKTADEQLGGDGKFFKTLTDKDGEFIGIKVTDPNDPSKGLSYYKDGYLRKNPEIAKKLGATFDSNGKVTYGPNHVSIIEHPQYQDVNNYLQAVKNLKIGMPDEAISKEIAKVLGDDLVVQTGSRAEPFSMNFLGGYLYRLDAAKAGGASTKSFKRLGREEFIEMHHTGEIRHKPYQTEFLQAQTKAENMAAAKITKNFYSILETKGPKQAFKFMQENLEPYPNLRIDVRIGDEWIQWGPKMSPEDAITRIQNEITDLFNKHMKGNPDAIKLMAEELGILRNYNPKISSDLKKIAKKGTERFNTGGFTGQSFDDLVKMYKEKHGMETKDAVTEALRDLGKLRVGGLVKPKRGLVDEPGGYAGVEVEGGLWGKYLMNKAEDIDMRQKFDALPEAQKKPMAVFLADEARLDRVRMADASVRYKTEPRETTIEDVKDSIAAEMINSKPVRFRWKDIPEAIQRNPLIRSMNRDMQIPFMLMGAIGNDIKNAFNGTEKEFYENFPTLAELAAPSLEKAWMPTPNTDPEAAYIDGFAEINRALDTGIRNLSYNTMDLILGGIDLASFGGTDLSTKLRESYDKSAKSDPETFLGDMVALLVEFGVPGGLVAKVLTRAQKALRVKGINTMTRYIDDDTIGTARFAMQMSNVAKRMGTGAAIFGAADFVAGGPYNSLHRMFPEDPTLLPGKPIDTKDLKGNELAVANFANRIRFAGDGAMIGGLFPLVGPAVWGAAKGTAKLPFKTIPGVNHSLFGGALRIAGVPIKIAADTLAGKVAYTGKDIPLIGKGIQTGGKWAAKGIQETAKFIGKQVFTRAALGAYDVAFAKQAAYSGIKVSKTFNRKLPEFSEWRKYSVNMQDPLHQYLARIDNKLAAFRDIGKLTKDAFGISSQTDLFMKSKSRVVDKYLRSIEREAYKMAKVFEDRHLKWGEYQTIQKKYLDDVLDFLQGNLKASQLPPKLRDLAENLKTYTNELKKEFSDMLPSDDPIKHLLASNIDKYMRRSFSMFTNSAFQPGKAVVLQAKEFIKDLTRKDAGLFRQAEEAFPDKPIKEAIDSYAELKVGDIMHTARYEMSDPFKALEKIVNKKLGMDDVKIVTGEEVPAAIRKLLGEEKNLKSSLLQTTGNIIASTQQKRALDQIAKMGKAGGWLFDTAEEALGKGKIFNAARLEDVKGSGFLPTDAIGLYGTPEMIRQLGGYSIFDSFLKNKVYQNILAFKAMVQGGKTLYSPATQMRNFGSASLFAMNVGHIGGSASVPQAMKIVLDDIFGAGPKVNRNDLIKYIERKVELGVTDENVVANELAGILADLKGTRSATGEPIITGFNQMLQKIGNTELSQYVQRTYAGGDNVWKIYGHEFYMSELKQFTKTIADVKKYFKDIVGREFVELSPKTGVKKTVAEGIEEMGAYLVRETYPTYSRVPPVVQALRKLPLGNFISFPAEMLRTSATTLSLSLKHIASGNPGLQAMGYRSLFGQFTTLYGVNEAVKGLGHHLTNVNPDMTRAYLEDLGPDFMQGHALVPLSNQDPKTGTFKAFDLSTYNPYAYVVDPVAGFIREINAPRLSKDIDGEVYNRIFDAAGPLMSLIEPFTTETIALEPAFDIWARQGRARNGSIIFSPSDDFGEKIEKSWNHILETIAPGFVRSAGQVLGALSLDTKGGRVMELGDVFLRLLGGSIMNVDPVQALDYKALDIREIRSNAYKTEHFFSKQNALERGPDVMAAEFQDIQNEALQAQFEIWKMFQQSLNSGLLTKKQIKDILGPDGRNVPNLDNLMDGKFTPVSYSENGLKQRANELYNEYKRNGITLYKSDLKPFYKLDKIIRKMKRIKFKDLLDESRDPMMEPTREIEEAPNMFQGVSETATNQVAPLPSVANPDVSSVNTTQVAGAVNPQTGLTTTEDALLSPSEKVIKQNQRGMA
jgi:hypothetical protein